MVFILLCISLFNLSNYFLSMLPNFQKYNEADDMNIAEIDNINFIRAFPRSIIRLSYFILEKAVTPSL